MAGTSEDQGFLPLLTLDVLEPGNGEVFHRPQDVFHTYAEEDFRASIQEAWYGALTEVLKSARCVWDGRWRLQHGSTRGSTPVPVARGCSASGAAVRG